MRKDLRWYDYITINIFWLGITTLSQTNALLFPLLVQQFVGEETKGTFFGTLRLWGLMVAVLVQALAGLISDRSTLRWGRRRPFIFIGTCINLILITAIGLTTGLEGMAGYWALFALAILQQVASNIAHGAEQGLIPDLVPEDQRGRYSGVKAVLEIPMPVILTALLIGPVFATGNMWGGILIAMATLLVTMIVTMFVREEPLREPPSKIDWTPFLRLLLMTGLFTAIILGLREVVKGVGFLLLNVSSTNVQMIAMGAVGLIAMAIAVGLGVLLSVRVSIGEAARRQRAFAWWVVNRLAFLIGTTNLSTFAVYFMQERLGYAEEEAAGPASQLMMVVGVVILLAALASGWLGDRFGHKRMVLISGIVATVGTIVLLLTTSLAIIYVGGCLVGGATGLFFTANWALGTRLVPKEEAGRYLGISNLAGAGAGAVGAYIGGPIADFFTTNVPGVPGLGYVLVFAIYGILFFLSVIALTQVRQTEQQPQSP
jgi:MFS family permease